MNARIYFRGDEVLYSTLVLYSTCIPVICAILTLYFLCKEGNDGYKKANDYTQVGVC